MAFAQYHQWTKLKGGYLMAVSKEAYDKAWSFIDAHDNEALNKMFIMGAIKKTVEGTEAYVEESHVFHGSREIRLKGGVQIYWVSEETLHVTDSLNHANQSNQVKEQPGNAVKIDGVILENDSPVFFIFQRGKMTPMKEGDHICDGEIIQTYFPDEDDGVTKGPAIHQYRIKLKIAKQDEIFANGDVVCIE